MKSAAAQRQALVVASKKNINYFFMWLRNFFICFFYGFSREYEHDETVISVSVTVLNVGRRICI